MTIRGMTALCTVSLILTACATAPDKSELQRVDGSEVKSVLRGNTLTYKASYGRWAEYHQTDSTGHAKAWGSWGSDIATSTYDIEDDGTVCWTYSGEPDWASPEHDYCNVFYKDADGNYYAEVTVNTSKPERLGNIRTLEIKSGDAYGLSGS